MKKQLQFRSLEDTFILLGSKAQKGTLTLERILKILSGKGRYFLVLLLSLPFCLPLQIPGLSTPFGLAIAFLGVRIAFGKNIWLPHKVLEKKISATHMKKMAKKGLWIVKKIKPFIHPRLESLCYNRVLHILNGVVILMLGVILALPIPIPLTNLIAAWSLFFMCIGLLEDDGVWVIVGYVASLITLGFIISLGFLIDHAVR